MKKSIILLLAVIFVNTAIAQDKERADDFLKSAVEIDALWPFYPGTLRAHYTRTLWQKGDLLLGVNIDFPVNRDTEGRFADYSIASGYRQYFWKGFHVEFNQTTGLGVLENHVSTGETYRGFDWLISGYIGYKFDVAKNSIFYLNLELQVWFINQIHGQFLKIKH